MPAPNFLKKLFANPVGEKFVLTLRNIPLLNRVAIACMPKHFHYEKNSLRKVARENINYQLDVSDWVDWNLFFKNNLNPDTELFSLVKAGMTVLDVGANMGELTLNFARRVGANGKVFSFEPSKENFNKLFNNVLLNPELKNRIQLFNLALGEREGKVFLQTNDEKNLGMNSISSSGDEVQMKTLDEIFSLEKIERCDLIKLDVEGYELNVLKGATKILSQHKPVLFFEMNNELLKQHGDSVPSMLSWLNEQGYKIISPELNEAQFSSGHFDVIAISF